MKAVTVPFFISHQGCPHTCIFCDQRTVSGAPGSLPGNAEIVAKIAAWRLSAGGTPLEAAFFGGTFSALPIEVREQLLAPLQPLLASGEITSVRISTRPDHIDADTVEWLAERGVRTIELGVQSMDDAVLDSAGRGHDAASSEAAIRCVKAHGLSVGAQLMSGLPGDTPSKALRSLERVIAAGADFVRIYPVVVLAGTELARRFAAGEYCPPGIEQGVRLCKVLLHAAMQGGVPVVRIGLQADRGLNADSVLAGCLHPAFGQLVRSELYFDLLCRLTSGRAGAAPLSIRCHPSRISDCIGQGRVNLERLRQQGVSASVRPDASLLREEVVVDLFGRCIKGNVISDLYFNINEV